MEKAHDSIYIIHMYANTHTSTNLHITYETHRQWLAMNCKKNIYKNNSNLKILILIIIFLSRLEVLVDLLPPTTAHAYHIRAFSMHIDTCSRFLCSTFVKLPESWPTQTLSGKRQSQFFDHLGVKKKKKIYTLHRNINLSYFIFRVFSFWSICGNRVKIHTTITETFRLSEA